MRRVFAVCAGAVLVLPTQAAGATTVGRVLPARNLTNPAHTGCQSYQLDFA